MGYAIAARVLLPFMGVIVAPLISVLTMKFARNRLQPIEKDKNRSFIFYNVLAGVLLGQFMCHTVVTDAYLNTRILYLFALSGFVVFHIVECEARLFNVNPNYVGPAEIQDEHEDDSLDRNTMEQKNIFVGRNVQSAEYVDQMWSNEDEEKDMRKRTQMLEVLLVVFTFIVITDGFVLVTRDPQDAGHTALLVLCYFGNGISMTSGIYGAMLHAKFHRTSDYERRGIRLWGAISAYWGLVLLCGTIPVLIGMEVADADAIIDHRAYLAFYGIASGCVLKLCMYYFERSKSASAERSTIRWGWLALVGTTAQSVVSGLWL